MTRTERTWHWKLWLCIAPLLGTLIALALLNRPTSTGQTAVKPMASEAKP